MDTLTTLIRFFQEGGFFMYPIAFTLAGGIAIAIERYLFLIRASAANSRRWDELQPLLASGKYPQALQLASQSKDAICRILGYGLQRLKTARRREDVETAMEEGLMEVVPRLEKRTHYLATFANIATLLGLLGTIIGLIQAFTVVAHANPSEKAAMLSSSISVAMNTTAFGLVVAIPLLLAHAWLSSRTTEIVDSLEMAAVRFVNLLHDKPAANGTPTA